MKRVVGTALVALLTAGLALGTPVAAEATKAKRDTPGCVSRAEFKSLGAGMTVAQVRAVVDTPGSLLGRADTSYWRAGTVKDGYWEENDHLAQSGYSDSDGTWVDTSTWVSDPYWVDTSFWAEKAVYVSRVNTVRGYKKCRSFDGGRDRVGINFDNYSSSRSGLRVFSKVRRNAVVHAMGTLHRG